MPAIKGKIYGVSGPAVLVKGMEGAGMNTICYVGRDGIVGEIIRIEKEFTAVQVYEDSAGLKLGEDVVGFSKPLTVTLGPGLIENVFDGIQRPLVALGEASGFFFKKGVKAKPFDMDKAWHFEPLKKKGDRVDAGDVIGVIEENPLLLHRVMVPYGINGVIKYAAKGVVTGKDDVCLVDGGGATTAIKIYHDWPVRTPRPFQNEHPPSSPFMTGQRVFDMLFPVAEGGIAVMPGGFGTGKTVTEHTIARFSKIDIIVYVGCGERGNEMTEVLVDFPKLKDPSTGLPLSSRTVIVVNTSDMPVAARESSIFTGITIAEFFRDMGFRVALMADSLSRWAEALREISSRLEEMPGEEGFPTYLSTRLGSFFERAGTVGCLGSPLRRGSVTIISALSPPGGDFSEPVTQASMRFAGALWALDTELAYRRHFPAVQWEKSFTLYYDRLKGWFTKEVSPDAVEMRERLFGILQREDELRQVVEIVGIEGLQDVDRLTFDTASILREVFLRQSVFDPSDSFSTYEKQYWMLKAIFCFFDLASMALKKGVYLEKVSSSPFRARFMKFNDISNEAFKDSALELIRDMEAWFLNI